MNQDPAGIVQAEVPGSEPATGTYSCYEQDNIMSTRGIFDVAKKSLGTFEYTPYLFTSHDLDPLTTLCGEHVGLGHGLSFLLV